MKKGEFYCGYIGSSDYFLISKPNLARTTYHREIEKFDYFVLNKSPLRPLRNLCDLAVKKEIFISRFIYKLVKFRNKISTKKGCWKHQQPLINCNKTNYFFFAFDLVFALEATALSEIPNAAFTSLTAFKSSHGNNVTFIFFSLRLPLLKTFTTSLHSLPM